MTSVTRQAICAATAWAALCLAGCEDKTAEHPAEPIRPALVADVKEETSKVFGPFAGTVAARYESSQGFRASGRMIKRYANIGDLVGKGQKLASLDETILRFNVVRSNADVLNAEAQLQRTQAADKRKTSLITSGAVPQSDVDTADADRKTATAQLAQAQAAMQKSKDQLGYADLYAEYDGVITAWSAEVGQDVSQGQNIVTIARPDVREAVVDIPDDLIGDVKEKAVFDVRLQASDSATAQGAVREIAPSSDAATRARRVRFSLQNPPDAFRLGSTVSVSFTRPIPPQIRIPEAAILDRDGKTAVWAIAAGADTVALRPIRVSDRQDGTATVDGSLQPGDRVVTAGIHRLKDGERVRPKASFP